MTVSLLTISVTCPNPAEEILFQDNVLTDTGEQDRRICAVSTALPQAGAEAYCTSYGMTLYTIDSANAQQKLFDLANQYMGTDAPHDLWINGKYANGAWGLNDGSGPLYDPLSLETATVANRMDDGLVTAYQANSYAVDGRDSTTAYPFACQLK